MLGVGLAAVSARQIVLPHDLLLAVRLHEEADLGFEAVSGSTVRSGDYFFSAGFIIGPVHFDLLISADEVFSAML